MKEGVCIVACIKSAVERASQPSPFILRCLIPSNADTCFRASNDQYFSKECLEAYEL